MTIQNDIWITRQAHKGMIEPFQSELIRRVNDLPTISYGLSSYGYDIRLSPKDFQIFRHIPGTVVDPKRFNPENLEPATLHKDDSGEYFILPAHTYGLGVALERLQIPDNVTVICIGKSTYARVGLIANLTPGEAGWQGHLTLEFSNSSSADVRVYANEGIVQLLFLLGDRCATTYADRNGKYQDQKQQVTPAKV